MTLFKSQVRGSASAFLSRWWRVAAAIVCCALVGAVVGVFTKPPGGVESGTTSGAKVGVLVTPVNDLAMLRAHVPKANGGVPPEASYWRGPGEDYGGFIFATADNPVAALNFSAGAGIEYANALTHYENKLMRTGNPPPRIRAAQRSVMRQPTRFRIIYQPLLVTAPPPVHFPGGPWRTGLIGAMVALLLLCLARSVPVPRFLSATADHADVGPVPRLSGASGMSLAGLAVGGLALAGVLAALASTSSAAYTTVLIGLLFAFAFTFTRTAGRDAVRILVTFVIVTAALRGALLGLANAINLPNGLTVVNAIQPALIAGCALAVLVERRGRFPANTKPLLMGWVLIAAAAILDFATQTVGLHVYAIGLAQYLAYPTLAILAWLVMERGDSERLIRLLIWVGAVVALSVFTEAIGLIKYVEAAAPNGDILTGNRYGGATGSYLHASIFLGTTAVLTLGMLLEGWRKRQGWLAVVLLAMMVGAMSLTLSRGGFVVAGIGGLALLVGSDGRDRKRLVGAGLAAVVIAAVLGVGGGVSPGKIGSRLGSGFNASGDPGNKLRFERMKSALEHYKGLSAPEKLVGEGLAATGNARTVASLPAIPTESYPLKLLLEVGAVGTLIIGGYLVWALIQFGKATIRGPTRALRSAAAAGIGFSLYGALYPTLEVQVLAMAWWILLVVCLARDRFRPPQHEDLRAHVPVPRREPVKRVGPIVSR